MTDYRDLGGLTRIAIIVLWVYTASDFVIGTGQYYLVGAPELAEDPTVIGALAIVSIVMLVGLFACYVLIGRWIYLASANAHRVSDELTITPGWAVGWYFIPFANLVKPYQAMREVWMASHFRGNWHGEPTPGSLIAWWSLWIITNILGNISFRMTLNNQNGDLAGAIAVVDLAASLLGVPLAYVLMTMMLRIADVQRTAQHDETFA